MVEENDSPEDRNQEVGCGHKSEKLSRQSGERVNR